MLKMRLYSNRYILYSEIGISENQEISQHNV